MTLMLAFNHDGGHLFDNAGVFCIDTTSTGGASLRAFVAVFIRFHQINQASLFFFFVDGTRQIIYPVSIKVYHVCAIVKLELMHLNHASSGRCMTGLSEMWGHDFQACRPRKLFTPLAWGPPP